MLGTAPDFEKLAGRLETEQESRELPHSDRVRHQRRKLGNAGVAGVVGWLHLGDRGSERAKGLHQRRAGHVDGRRVWLSQAGPGRGANYE